MIVAEEIYSAISLRLISAGCSLGYTTAEYWTFIRAFFIELGWIQLTTSLVRIIGVAVAAISLPWQISTPLFPLLSTERLPSQMISCENSLKGNSRKLNKWETNKFSICLLHHLGITPEKVPFDPLHSINQSLISLLFYAVRLRSVRVI